MAHDHRTVTPSPFVPGARVAVETQTGGWRAPNDLKEGFVEKVHKNGNFTLVGSQQQYRGWNPSAYENFWHASATGSSNARLRIWDDTTDADIRSKMARADLHRRFHRATASIARIAFDEKITPDVVVALEAALTALKGSPTEASALLDASPSTLSIVPNSQAKTEVGMDWKLSDEAKKQIDAIDENRQNAMVNAYKLIAR